MADPIRLPAGARSLEASRPTAAAHALQWWANLRTFIMSEGWQDRFQSGTRQASKDFRGVTVIVSARAT
jgi:hypothetical protein